MSKASTAAAPPRRSWLWLQGAVGGGVAVAAPGTALLVAVLLCPALVFYLTETAKGRPVGRTMLLTGSTALFLPLRTLWEHGNNLGTAMDILADPGCPLLAWLGCAAGWMMCEAIQVATRFILAAQVRRKTAALRREKAELNEEWTFEDAVPPA